jgi:hypothetical protein
MYFEELRRVPVSGWRLSESQAVPKSCTLGRKVPPDKESVYPTTVQGTLALSPDRAWCSPGYDRLAKLSESLSANEEVEK